MNYDIQKLGVPDIQMCGIQIWIHNLQFPKAKEFWDAGWLNATAHCGAHSADVWVSGSIIHLTEIESWHEQIINLYNSLHGEANLSCMEPELDICIIGKDSGHMEMRVKITPDHLTQEHIFEFELDQSYLPELILNCKNILAKYPIRK